MKPRPSQRPSSAAGGKWKSHPEDAGCDKARIHARLTPRSSKDSILGKEDGVYRIKVKAPPLEGRANKALIALLAKALRVPKRDVEISSGEKSRDKTLLIRGLTPKEVEERLLQNRSAS
ncbi:MAG: DUF167 family protein [Desulfobacteraceae bacterium]|jgi:uncharacterized protein (TIGR00251 family)